MKCKDLMIKWLYVGNSSNIQNTNYQPRYIFDINVSKWFWLDECTKGVHISYANWDWLAWAECWIMANYHALETIHKNEVERLRYYLETFRVGISDFFCNDHQIRFGLQKFSVPIYLFWYTLKIMITFNIIMS